MLFKFWVRSDGSEDFVMQLDADATNTFFQLHETLQEECGFDPSQMVTFFAADEEWDKGSEIKMFGSNPFISDSAEEKIMKNTRLSDIVRTEEDKLLYTYDLSNDKSLYLELFEIKMEQSVNNPTVKSRKGKTPLQENVNGSAKYSGPEIDEDSQQTSDDLGELEDLYGIYGEMSNTIL